MKGAVDKKPACFTKRIMETILQTRKLCAFYGDTQVLFNINMDIPVYRITAVIGPSGCGKSTFLRCLNRMHELVPGARVEGEVLLEGESIYGKRVDPVLIRKRVGMVFQKPNPFPTMSIFENVVAGLRLNGSKKKNLKEIAEMALHRAALWDEVKNKLHQPATSLSGGQQQRLCIARALAVEPEVLLLDEPCSALDPTSTLRIEGLMEELKERLTIVIVTHNMQQAARVSDYTGVFIGGRLIEFGETKQIFSTPSQPETESYITGRFG